MKIAPTFTVRTVLLNFGPWIVYGCLSAAGYAGPAYGGGLAVSAWQTAPQWRKRRLKLMDGVSLLFFLAGTISTVLFHSPLFPQNGSVLIWSTFAAVAWGSLLLRAPFTAEYAREAVPETFWSNPGFRRVNVVVTEVWGSIFAVSAALAVLMRLHPHWLSGSLALWLQSIPYAGTLFGIVFTNRFPQWASRRKPEHNLNERNE